MAQTVEILSALFFVSSDPWMFHKIKCGVVNQVIISSCNLFRGICDIMHDRIFYRICEPKGIKSRNCLATEYLEFRR